MAADENLPVTTADFDELADLVYPPTADEIARGESVYAVIAHAEAERAFREPHWLAKLLGGAA